MLKRRPAVPFVLAAAVSLLFASCTTILAPGGKPDPYQRDDENFQDFLDVPYPSALSLEKAKTEVYERRGVLSGSISLLGKLSPDELMDYYDRHLPPHGWSPLGEVQTENEIVSTWVKGNKTLTLDCSKVTLALGADVRLRILVQPPHTKADLGKRVIYRDTSEPGRTWSTTPQRERGGGSYGGGGHVSEEDI
ncbi:MAG: hypothetical protein LBR53_03915 [Deltaproteobacteria bacterium]|jgi:hypothetical protein|nr:hypothetical protein [Deltaproteobacteria bacterium]